MEYMTVYQTFIRLLYEAHSASMTVDDYDLHSEAPEKFIKWKSLINEEHKSFADLIAYIQLYGDEIISQLDNAYLS